MKQLLIGFILGVIVCMVMGAELYHPIRSIIVRTETQRSDIAPDIKAIMMNQESIYNLVKTRCGDR